MTLLMASAYSPLVAGFNTMFIPDLDISIFLAGLHSELTTQRHVTPKKIKMENKAEHPTPRKASDQFGHLRGADVL